MIITKKYLDELTYNVLGSAIEVHKELGPGLLESVYHTCLFHELRLRNIHFQSQIVVPLNFKGNNIEANLRCDFLVEQCLVVELKATDLLAPVLMHSC